MPESSILIAGYNPSPRVSISISARSRREHECVLVKSKFLVSCCAVSLMKMKLTALSPVWHMLRLQSRWHTYFGTSNSAYRRILTPQNGETSSLWSIRGRDYRSISQTWRKNEAGIDQLVTRYAHRSRLREANTYFQKDPNFRIHFVI